MRRMGDRRRPRRAERVRLRLAAALGDRLGEVREEHGQPEPDARSPPTNQSWLVFAAREVEEEDHRRDHAAELDDEHHRVAGTAGAGRASGTSPGSRRGRSRARRCCSLRAVTSFVSSSSARLSSSTLTPGSPKKPSERPSVLLVDQLLRRSSSGSSRTAAIRARLELRVGGRDVRVDARARGRDRVDRDVADREARVVRPLELEDRARAPPDVLGEVRVRRAEVGEGRRRRRCTAGAVAEGRSMEVARLVNSWAASREPTTLPSRSIRLPSALSWNATAAKPGHQRG